MLHDLTVWRGVLHLKSAEVGAVLPSVTSRHRWRAGRSFLPASHGFPSRESGPSLDLRLRPPNARWFVSMAGRARTVSTLPWASRKLGIPLVEGGVPRTVRIPSARRRAVAPVVSRSMHHHRAEGEDAVPPGRVNGRPCAFLLPPAGAGGAVVSATLCTFAGWCRPDCLTICGHSPVMPRGNVHVTDPARTVSARQRASLALRIPL